MSVLNLIDEDLYRCVASALSNKEWRQMIAQWIDQITFGWDALRKGEAIEKVEKLLEKANQVQAQLKEDLAPEWLVEEIRGILSDIQESSPTDNRAPDYYKPATLLVEVVEYVNNNNLIDPGKSPLVRGIKDANGMEEKKAVALKWVQSASFRQLEARLQKISEVLVNARREKYQGRNLSYGAIARMCDTLKETVKILQRWPEPF